MNINSFYTVICVSNLGDSVSFFKSNFDFEAVFENSWYVHLKIPNTGYNLAIMDFNHDSLPEQFRNSAQGIMLNFEIDDADFTYNKFKSENVNIVQELRDEPWGQKHFIVSDPSGVLVDVIQLIEPSNEYKDQYLEL